jgi:hypothetical protein
MMKNHQTTTLNEILKHSPCGIGDETEGFGKFLKYLGKTQADDEPVTLLQILDSNGLDDCLWAFRACDYEKWMSELACDYAEHVLHIYETRKPGDTRVRDCIETTRKYLRGEASLNEMRAAARSAWSAESAAESAWSAARSAWSAESARSAAWSAAWSAERKWQEAKLKEYLEDK